MSFIIIFFFFVALYFGVRLFPYFSLLLFCFHCLLSVRLAALLVSKRNLIWPILYSFGQKINCDIILEEELQIEIGSVNGYIIFYVYGYDFQIAFF